MANAELQLTAALLNLCNWVTRAAGSGGGGCGGGGLSWPRRQADHVYTQRTDTVVSIIGCRPTKPTKRNQRDNYGCLQKA